jgi:hypothetical protein
MNLKNVLLLTGISIINGKGKNFGAGGMNTNLFGKRFEFKTNNKDRLLSNGYIKKVFGKCTYLLKSISLEKKNIVFVLHTDLKKYVKHKYNIELFRFPDEAYIIKDNLNKKTVVKILEKKEQHVEGSMETKLWSGPSLKREYEIMLGPGFEVHYGFCVSAFLKQKLESDIPKYMILRQIWRENNIQVLFGDDEDYFDKLDEWINV